MNGIARVFLSAWIFLCISPLASADLEEAWEAWGDGDIERVWGLVEEAGGSGGEEDGWKHLRFFVSCVSGRYEDALGVYDSISSDYSRLGELDGAYVDACGHLGRLDDAAAFAKRRGMADSTVAFLELQAVAPLRVTPEGVIVIPFADHPLTRYFPGFDAELNGESVVAHVDTGGTFLIMGPERAEILGIETVSAGKGFHGSNSVDMRVGIAESFRLGDVLLENVPVATLASLKGSQDFVIFGTNLLEQFYSTLDYPRMRLILSPRGDATLTAEHRGMLGEKVARVPFYMWGGHYMFARGGLGRHGGLNFFIDSGLVSIHPDGEGGMIQDAFTTTRENFGEWGVLDEKNKARQFQLNVPLKLGGLEQEGLFAVVMSVGSQNFGGVRIDGLLSHAFLKAYSWTIDFDSREYLFATQ